MFKKLKNYFIRGIKYRPTYYILAFFSVIFIAMMLSSIYAAKNDFINAFTISVAIVFLVDLFCLMFKWGFLSTTISRYKKNKDESKKNKEKIMLDKMTSHERNVYNEVMKRRALKEKQKQKIKPPKSNLGWYFVLWVSLIAFIVSIPFVF